MRRHRNLLELMKYQKVSAQQARIMLAEGVRQQLRYARALSEARIKNANAQQILPLCERCGCGHDHRYELDGSIHPYCERCTDEIGIESLVPLMLLHHGDDDEAALDRMYKAFPDWFERGVMPDYWYALKARRVTSDHP
jgi:hypothetical protein